MRINRAAIKADAKQDIRQTKPNIIVFTLVFALIVWVLNFLVGKLSGYTELISNVTNATMLGDDRLAQAYFMNYEMPGLVPSVIILAIGLMETIMNVGYSLFCVNVVRRRAASYGNLMDPFAMFFKVIWLNILMGIFIYLWTLLLVIPGIIAAYRYRMAVYIMLDNPDMSALDCIRESKRLTNGHKMELFVLDLSFIGWSILSMVPLVTIWVAPYIELTNVRFYVALCEAPSVFGGDGGQGGQYGQYNQYGQYGQYGGDFGRRQSSESGQYPPYGSEQNQSGGWGQDENSSRNNGSSPDRGGKPPWES